MAHDQVTVERDLLQGLFVRDDDLARLVEACKISGVFSPRPREHAQFPPPKSHKALLCKALLTGFSFERYYALDVLRAVKSKQKKTHGYVPLFAVFLYLTKNYVTYHHPGYFIHHSSESLKPINKSPAICISISAISFFSTHSAGMPLIPRYAPRILPVIAPVLSLSPS